MGPDLTDSTVIDNSSYSPTPMLSAGIDRFRDKPGVFPEIPSTVSRSNGFDDLPRTPGAGEYWRGGLPWADDLSGSRLRSRTLLASYLS